MLRYFLASIALALAATPAKADWSATALTQSYVADQNIGDVDHVSYACSAPGNYCDQEVPQPNGYTVAYAHDQTSGKVIANSLSTGTYPIYVLNHPPFYVPISLIAGAHAAADLSRGEVEVANSGSPIPYGIGSNYAGTNATASLSDNVQFHSNSMASFNVGVDLVLTGSDAYYGYSLLNFYALPTYGAGSGVHYEAGYYAPFPGGNINSFVNDGFTEVSFGVFHGVLTVVPNANPAYSAFEIGESLFSEDGISAVKALFKFDLPIGVTLVSDSGRLLTASVIPEPATWALLVAGFSLVGATLRRRRVVA